MSNGLIVIPNWPNFCSRATVDTIFLLLLFVVLKSLVFLPGFAFISIFVSI